MAFEYIDNQVSLISRNISIIIGLFFHIVDQGINKGKMKVAQNEKRKKLCGFLFFHKHSKL